METQPYRPPLLMRGSHLSTIVPALLRRPAFIEPAYERLPTPDDDFLELDWYRQGKRLLTIISHGLEGDSRRPYVVGMARAFYHQGYDVLAWNYRGCGPTLNRQPRLYHSGATDDLHTVVQHAIRQGYERLILVGFSLGGNITLKYVGEQKDQLPSTVAAAIAWSVPLDLAAGSQEISKPHNFIYEKRFLNRLRKKIILKHRQYPDIFDTRHLKEIKNLYQFDDRYTGPLHGFAGADDYYARCSSVHFLPGIRVPTLIVNALNDPFLPEACYPLEVAAANPLITFETPAHGGHVGFATLNNQGLYWSEQRSLAFAAQVLADEA